MSKRSMMLDTLLETPDTSSPVWREFREAILEDFGLDQHVDENALWNFVFSEMPSASRKGSMVKMSRWFSWSQSCDEQLKEIHAPKMVHVWRH